MAAPLRVAIQSVCEDTEGVLWGAAQNGQLVRRLEGKWIPALTDAAWLGSVTCVAADPRGALWIGTRNRKLHRWKDGQHTTWDQKTGFGSRTVTALLPTSQGDLWIASYGTATAFQVLREEQLRTLNLPENTGRIRALTEDAAGNIWAGTANGQLLRVDNDHLKDETGATSLPGRPIECLYATPDGALWIGYRRDGLGRLEHGLYSKIGLEQGLPNDHISQILSDDEGWFWLGTDRGISKIRGLDLERAMMNLQTRLRPVQYGRSEGLLSMEADGGLVPGALKSRDGRLWIPMRTALAVADPKVVHKNALSPPVFLMRVSVDGQTIAAYGSNAAAQNLANRKMLRAPLQLGPRHHELEFEFDALNYSAPENVHFRYQLTGIDDSWVDGGTLRAVRYPRLPEGRYSFRIQACNGAGPWNEAPGDVALVVAPFFWQTWPFRLVVLACFTFAVAIAVRYLSFRRLRLNLRLAEERAAL